MDSVAEAVRALLPNLTTGGPLGTVGMGSASAALRAALVDIQPGARALDAELVAIAVAGDELVTASVQQAVEIAEAGWQRIQEIARAGVPEYIVAAEADIAMKERGAQDNFLYLSASQHNRAVHAPTDRVLAAGDILLAEISPCVDGRFAQISAPVSSAQCLTCAVTRSRCLPRRSRRAWGSAGPALPCATCGSVNAPVVARG